MPTRPWQRSREGSVIKIVIKSMSWGFGFVDHLPFAECIPQIRDVYQWYSDITDDKVLSCQPGEVLRQSINSLFLLRFLWHSFQGMTLTVSLTQSLKGFSHFSCLCSPFPQERIQHSDF
jgi:hypothetical protein